MAKEDTIDLSCSFCGKGQREVRKIIAGPTVYICDECIKRCNEIIAEETRRPDPSSDRARAKSPNQRLRCSFCGKDQREVRKLIAGPTVYICDECIGLCNDIICEEMDLERVAKALRSVLRGDARALLATILERGSGAAERLSDTADRRFRPFYLLDRILYPVRKALFRVHRVLYPVHTRISERTLVLVALGELVSGWRTLRTIVGESEPVAAASSPSTPVEIPAWLRPVAERLTSTVEVLEALSPRFEKGRLEESRESLEFANAQLRHARDLLTAGPPGAPAAS